MLHERAAVAAAEASLAELARVANASHEAGERSQSEALARYRTAGQALLEAKRRIGHGGWLAWVRAHLGFGERRAQQYMAFAKSAVTADSGELAETWRRVSGNTPAAGADEEEVPQARWVGRDEAPDEASEAEDVACELAGLVDAETLEEAAEAPVVRNEQAAQEYSAQAARQHEEAHLADRLARGRERIAQARKLFAGAPVAQAARAAAGEVVRLLDLAARAAEGLG